MDATHWATMSGLRQKAVSEGRMIARACCAAAFAVLAAGVHAQQPQPPQSPRQSVAEPPADTQAAPPAQPGFIDAFGHWIQDSVSNWNAGVKGAADVAKDAADAAGSATRDAAGAMARFPASRVVAERATCPTAPNGAPDCRVAAEAVCKAHGFATGSSIDFQTAEKCPPVALNRPAGEPPPRCVIESYVTRALCQ
jgi:hypothetical protein